MGLTSLPGYNIMLFTKTYSIDTQLPEIPGNRLQAPNFLFTTAWHIRLHMWNWQQILTETTRYFFTKLKNSMKISSCLWRVFMKCWLGKSALDTEKAVCVYVCEENENKRVWSTSLCMSAPVSSRVSACQTCMVWMRACLYPCRYVVFYMCLKA